MYPFAGLENPAGEGEAPSPLGAGEVFLTSNGVGFGDGRRRIWFGLRFDRWWHLRDSHTFRDTQERGAQPDRVGAQPQKMNGTSILVEYLYAR
jgi:hypothetical protein